MLTKIKTRVKVTDFETRSNLLWYIIDYGRKKFYSTGLVTKIKKRIFLQKNSIILRFVVNLRVRRSGLHKLICQVRVDSRGLLQVVIQVDGVAARVEIVDCWIWEKGRF
jgi:hypothetical protein